MRTAAALLATACLAAGCAGNTRLARSLPPGAIKPVAIRTVVNRSQQFGLEDALMLAIRDQFLRDGNVPIAPESAAYGIVAPTITRYILTPVQYDASLNPTAYKLDIKTDLQFIDRATGAVLWTERNMDVFEIYPASMFPGGKTEQQAQADLWDELSRDIVKRVLQGYAAAAKR